MAVAIDAKIPSTTGGTQAAAYSASAATLTTPSMTVGGTATAVLAVLSLDTAGADPTGVTCTWNSVSMTQLIGPVKLTGSGSNAFTYIFGLAAPATGAHTFVAAWTGACSCYLAGLSFTGTDTTTPFVNANSATNQSGTSASLDLTFITNGMELAVFNNVGSGWSVALNGGAVVNWWRDQNFTQNCAVGYSSADDTFTDTMVTGVWSAAGIVIQPPGGATAWSGVANLSVAGAFASGAAIVTASGLILGDRVLTNGLAALDAEADKMFICSAKPTTYTEAITTFALGNKNWGAGNAFGAPGAGSPNGRKVDSTAITDGSITAGGTAAYWAAVDSSNSRLLATGLLSASVAVTNGWIFTLGSFSVHIPAS